MKHGKWIVILFHRNGWAVLTPRIKNRFTCRQTVVVESEKPQWNGICSCQRLTRSWRVQSPSFVCWRRTGAKREPTSSVVASSLASHLETVFSAFLWSPMRSHPTNSAESYCFPNFMAGGMTSKIDPNNAHLATSDVCWSWQAVEPAVPSRGPLQARQTCHPCSKPIARLARPNACSMHCWHCPRKGPGWPASSRQANCNGLSQWWPLQCRRSDSNEDQLRKPAACQFL